MNSAGAGDDIVLIERFPDIDDYLRMRAVAGMHPKTREAAERALPNTLYGVRLERDGQVVGMGRVIGDIALTGHFTPGHTPGSTSWTWTDTRDGKPLRIAYVDSLSAPGYALIGNARFPRIVDTYTHTFDVVRGLPCDLLLTPHPDASGWTPADAANPHPQPMTCRAYADGAQTKFDAELAKQRTAKK